MTITEICSVENLERLRQHDLATFVLYDDNGLLIGPDESVENYIVRLQELEKNISELYTDLRQQGRVKILTTDLCENDLIPSSIFQSANEVTQELYDFQITWVPGFFTSANMGFLFAGCALYSYTDFFAVFFIRNAFRHQQKWIIYGRTELIAHELTHVAHIGFRTPHFEELLAYQTAASWFRRRCGGVLQSNTDTYILMTAICCLFLAQMINIIMRSPFDLYRHPMPLIIVLCIFPIIAISGRYLMYYRRFQRAFSNLSQSFQQQHVLPILFRLPEEEIRIVSQFRSRDSLKQWIQERCTACLRWKIILTKYPLS